MIASAAAGGERRSVFICLDAVSVTGLRCTDSSHAFKRLWLCESDSGASAARIAPSRLPDGRIWVLRRSERPEPVEQRRENAPNELEHEVLQGTISGRSCRLLVGLNGSRHDVPRRILARAAAPSRKGEWRHGNGRRTDECPQGIDGKDDPADFSEARRRAPGAPFDTRQRRD